MGVSSSLHFIGKEQVLTAYRNRGLDAWSLWCGKQFLTKGMDEEELNVFLSSIWQGSVATYTLKVYEDIKTTKDIKEKTECDGSFNFRLVERDDEYVPGTARGRMERELIELKEQVALLAQQHEQEPENDEPETIGRVVMGILQDPEKLERTIGNIKSLFGIVQPMPAQIGNVSMLHSEPEINTMSTETKKNYSEAELTRLYAAVEKLCAADYNIVTHMERLAAIAEQNPAQFKILLSMLETFK